MHSEVIGKRAEAASFRMSRLSRPTARLMSRLSRLKLSARLCNLGLNSDAARPSKSGHESGTSTRELKLRQPGSKEPEAATRLGQKDSRSQQISFPETSSGVWFFIKNPIVMSKRQIRINYTRAINWNLPWTQS